MGRTMTLRRYMYIILCATSQTRRETLHSLGDENVSVRDLNIYHHLTRTVSWRYSPIICKILWASGAKLSWIDFITKREYSPPNYLWQ